MAVSLTISKYAHILSPVAWKRIRETTPCLEVLCTGSPTIVPAQMSLPLKGLQQKAIKVSYGNVIKQIWGYNFRLEMYAIKQDRGFAPASSISGVIAIGAHDLRLETVPTACCLPCCSFVLSSTCKRVLGPRRSTCHLYTFLHTSTFICVHCVGVCIYYLSAIIVYA